MNYLVIFVFGAFSLLQAQTSPVFGQELDQHQCHVNGLEPWVTCGTLAVPLDWSGEVAGEISLGYVIVPALKPSGAPPLFILAGGPGQAATELAAIVDFAFEDVMESRDIILLDQRGTGRSNPLTCDALREAEFGSTIADAAEILLTCLDTPADHLGFFTSWSAIRDLDAFRQALGLDKIALWGGSYGSRMGLLYLRHYAEHVEVAVLDGIAPASRSFFITAPDDAQAALDALFDDCANDVACNTAYPNLPQEFERATQILAEGGEEIAIIDPITGKPLRATLKPQFFGDAVRGALYSTAASSQLPAVISAAAERNFAPLIALGATAEQSDSNPLYLGMMLSVLCSEDLQRIDPADMDGVRARSFREDRFYETFKAGCSNWTVGFSEGTGEDPIDIDVPVLLLSGAIDPVTGPSNGDYIQARLPNSTHLVAAKTGHGVTASRCGAKIVAEFLETLDGSALDTGCLQEIERPPFYISGQAGGERQ